MSVHACMHDHIVELCWQDLINQLWKFRQIYNFCAFGDIDELSRFWGQNVIGQDCSETADNQVTLWEAFSHLFLECLDIFRWNLLHFPGPRDTYAIFKVMGLKAKVTDISWKCILPAEAYCSTVWHHRPSIVLACFCDLDLYIHVSSNGLFLLCCIQRHLYVEYLFVYTVNYYKSCCHCYL